MVYVIVSVAIVLLSLFDYVYIKRKSVLLSDKKINILALLPKGFKQIACYVSIPLSLILIAYMFMGFYDYPVIYTMKHICIIAVLWPMAVSDFKEYRIPNKLVLYGFILRMIMLISELIFDLDIVVSVLINEAIALVGVTVICVLCMFIFKGSIGMGDLKMMMFMAAFLGVEGIIYSMFVSMVFSASIAIVLLLIKKKERRDVIPFAPFVLFGTIVSMILTGV